MSTLVGAAVCLALRFEWNGQPLEAGRSPIYGVEEPNVKRRPEPVGTRESILYPLSPAPFRFLADMTAGGHSVNVVLEPPLPPTPGELRVRLSIVPCTKAPAAKAPSVAPGEAPEFRVSLLRRVGEGPGAGTVARGVLAEAAPLELVLPFARALEPQEPVSLVIAATRGPEAEFRLDWDRFLHPGQERFVWREAPPVPGRK